MYNSKYHDQFFYDLEKLNSIVRKRVLSKIDQIENNPTRFKHLSGRNNCYSVRVGEVRIIYLIDQNVVEFLMVEQRNKVYQTYYKRLSRVREELAHYGIAS